MALRIVNLYSKFIELAPERYTLKAPVPPRMIPLGLCAQSFKGVHINLKPGTIARSVSLSLGNQEAPRSILASGTSFREDLVMILFLRPFFLFR